MKNTFFKILLLFAGVVFLPSCSDSDNSPNITEDDDIEITFEVSKGVSLSRAEQEVANGQTRLALSFFKKYEETNRDGNFVCAPFSLSNVLAMLANGADSEIREDINSVYGLTTSDLESINALHSKLLRELPTIDSKANFTSANCVVLLPGLDFNTKFKEAVVNLFGAEMKNLDLGTNEGVSQFNNWCNEKTNGMIPKMFDAPIPTVFAVASADYFNAKWRMPFDKKDTKPMPFYNGAGGKSQVSTMSNVTKTNICSNGEMSVIQLFYGNKAFRFSVILPGTYDSDNGYTLTQTINSLTIDKWEEINKNTYEWDYILYMPKFDVATEGDISKIVQNLGLTSLFSINGLSDMVVNCSGLTLGTILQSVRINVSENGTKAASVTTGIMAGSNYNDVPAPEEIHIDRPFAFIIDETSTGAILYAGVVRNL